MKYTSLPIGELQTWAHFNDVVFNNIIVTENITSKDGIDKGAGLLAAAGFSDHGASQEVLLTVPADLVLSKETVYLCAKADLRLQEILDAVGNFAEVGSLRYLRRVYWLLAVSGHVPFDRRSTSARTEEQSTDMILLINHSLPGKRSYSSCSSNSPVTAPT